MLFVFAFSGVAGDPCLAETPDTLTLRPRVLREMYHIRPPPTPLLVVQRNMNASAL